jgi:tRNA A-37 threonylcarbamoyl transferase component Bud32
MVASRRSGLVTVQRFRHRDLPPTVLDDINRALGKLHDGQLVYGDMRRSNIMVVKKPKSRDDDGDEEGEDGDE